MNKIVAAVKRKGLPFEFVEYMGMNGVIKAVRVNYTGLRPPLIKGAVVINHNVYNESMTLVTEEQAESLKAYSKALEILSLAFWNTLRDTRDKDRAVAAQRATAEKHNCLNVFESIYA